jgi:hypothetical protein
MYVGIKRKKVVYDCGWDMMGDIDMISWSR